MPYAFTTDRSFHASSRPTIPQLPLASRFFSTGRVGGVGGPSGNAIHGPPIGGTMRGLGNMVYSSPLNDAHGQAMDGEDRTPALPYTRTLGGRMGTLARTSAMVHRGFFDLLSMLPNTVTGDDIAGVEDHYGIPQGHRVMDSNASDHIAKDWQDEPLLARPYEETIARAQVRTLFNTGTINTFAPPLHTGSSPSSSDQRSTPHPITPNSDKPPIPPATRGKSTPNPRLAGGDYPPPVMKLPEDWRPLTKPKGMLVIDKRKISWPLEFRHVAHASTDEEARFLLMRWVMEGQGKVADPLWAKGIREQVRLRAADQQARAIAQVMVAREQGLIQNQPYQTLRVVNGMPSSIYSSTLGTIRQAIPKSKSSPILPKSSPALSLLGPGTPRQNMLNPFEATFKPIVQAQVINAMAERPMSPPTQPLRLKSNKKFPVVVQESVVLPQRRGPQVVLPEEIDGRRFSSHTSIMEFSDRPDQAFPPTKHDRETTLIFAREITPSLATLEKAASTAIFFETHYHALLKPPKLLGAVHANNYVLARERRRLALEEEMALQGLDEGQKQTLRSRWLDEETFALREKRRKVGTHSFTTLKNIGHGAFGVVSLVQEKESGNLFAMKRLRKNDMLRKGQEGHIRAEKDLLAAAASVGGTMSSWIVKLHYSFQDVDHLYLVLAYEGGGDLLNLLIERDTFSESFTRFYMAELVLALEATHSLGYIHRDIKPDNLLLSSEGHLRVSDFGLAHDTHWSHDTAYYEQQRRALLKRHGIDLEEPSGKQIKTMKRKEVEKIMGKEWLAEGEGMLTWRDKKRRTLAFSVCGTNSYMSPEVIRGTGYGFSTDWWSLGVIAFECLYGYPPFVSNSRHVTRQKILNWRQSLRFPPKPKFSAVCTDFLAKLLCEPEDRLGSIVTPSPAMPNSLVLEARMTGSIKGSMKASPSSQFGVQAGDGAAQLKSHPWFDGIDWATIHTETPPYLPNLRHAADTQHFDDNIPDQPLAAPDGAPSHATKDPMLADRVHGPQLLELRKGMAFAGWTYKANKMPEHRLAALRELSYADTTEDSPSDEEEGATPTASVMRARAMSF